MQIVPLIDPYSIHYDTYSGGIYTLNSDSISLLAGTLGAKILEVGGALGDNDNWMLKVVGNNFQVLYKVGGIWKKSEVMTRQ